MRFGNLIEFAADWEEANPLLFLGEIGIERDTNGVKIGDGVTLWNNLPYLSPLIIDGGEDGYDNTSPNFDLSLINTSPNFEI